MMVGMGVGGDVVVMEGDDEVIMDGGGAMEKVDVVIDKASFL